jgi:hypothetical protein
MAEQNLKEERILPFHIVAMEKQLDILEAFTILRKEGKIDISYKDVASRVKIKSKTNVSACLKFWYSIGLLEKKDGL